MKQPALTHLGTAKVYEFILSQMDTAREPHVAYLMSLTSHLRGPITWRKTYRSKICGVDHQETGLRGQSFSWYICSAPGARQQGNLVQLPRGMHTRALQEDRSMREIITYTHSPRNPKQKDLLALLKPAEDQSVFNRCSARSRRKEEAERLPWYKVL